MSDQQEFIFGDDKFLSRTLELANPKNRLLGILPVHLVVVFPRNKTIVNETKAFEASKVIYRRLMIRQENYVSKEFPKTIHSLIN